jgi:glyoxylase-like metal-dependent hydrolase (beta-lactamase superfamily II)
MTKQQEPFIEEIFPSFYRVEIPLPDSPLKSINSYMIKSGERNLIIDTGMNNRLCFDTIISAIKKLDIDIEHTDFFITHQHIDHIGLAGKLISTGSRCYFNRPEADIIHTSSLTQWVNRVTVFASLHGFIEEGISEMKTVIAREEQQQTIYPEFTIIKENDMLNIGDYSFHCIETPGHSLGHMCLYEADHKILISGDHVLGDITPNISSRFNEDNPLQEYIDSLEKIYSLDVELCLPGHRKIITDFRKRINELKQHHYERADEIIEILNIKSCNAYQIASRMKWDMSYETFEEFPVFPKWFAFSEALSHLLFLEESGRVKRITLPDNHILYSGK